MMKPLHSLYHNYKKKSHKEIAGFNVVLPSFFYYQTHFNNCYNILKKKQFRYWLSIEG
jgi:hypothetical protein